MKNYFKVQVFRLSLRGIQICKKVQCRENFETTCQANFFDDMLLKNDEDNLLGDRSEINRREMRF